GGAGNMPAHKTPTRVFVLSRVTLGADVAITSIILDAAKRRFPQSESTLVGSRKSYELFAADPRIRHLEINYPRTGSLRERLGAWHTLRDKLSIPDAITIDPDSRLTQLGLLPVCPEDSYYFFETRSYGGDTSATLGQLTRDWVRATFGISGARAYIAPEPFAMDLPRPIVSISLGVGENPAKRLSDLFEANLLRGLVTRGASLYIDSGAGGEEAERVERAAALSGAPAHRIKIERGSFAAFASAISQSALYVGYDSAGQHVAAACGIPLVTVFAGFPTERMLSRWRPDGPGRIEVVRADHADPDALAAIDRLGIL
ncbi:MAG: glycosyltransferase family 9 protein, partial [Bryobacteraceae bacterium]